MKLKRKKLKTMKILRRFCTHHRRIGMECISAYDQMNRSTWYIMMVLNGVDYS